MKPRVIDTNVDIGLDVLCALAPEGAHLTWNEIADVCGCTSHLIKGIERRAIYKLRKKFKKDDFYKLDKS